MLKRLEQWGKALLRAPLVLLPKSSAPPLPAPDGSIRSVLVVRPDERIGNLILLTPMIDAMRSAWPGALIDVVAGGAMQGLFRGDPRINDIVVFDKRALVRNPFRLLPIALRIRGRYDLAVDASHGHNFSLTSALLTRVSGARYRLGTLRGPAHRFLNTGLEYNGSQRNHTADFYIDLLRIVAPSAMESALTLPLAGSEKEAAWRLLEAAGVQKGEILIGIHPGGRGRKRWPVENFVDLAGRLSKPGRRIVLFHGPGEEDLVAQFPEGLVTRLPRLSLRDLAAAMSSCRLFISGDTGPMHLAQAVGVPTLALFLVDNADMFGPRGPAHRVLFDPKGLDVPPVHAAAEAMLKEPAPAG